jgi:hypothetical protein
MKFTPLAILNIRNLESLNLKHTLARCDVQQKRKKSHVDDVRVHIFCETHLRIELLLNDNDILRVFSRTRLIVQGALAPEILAFE